MLSMSFDWEAVFPTESPWDVLVTFAKDYILKLLLSSIKVFTA